MPQPAHLGGFTLERLLGRGGMADVWLGRHDLSGEPAAIKVITRRWAHERRFREGFRKEVRAVAGLDHPGIVAVFDTGTVPDGAQIEGLTPGSPWLAMQLAEHGELRRLPAPMDWPLLREVLLQILDALAHAHARDVIHRDLKPENVLLRIEHDRLRLVLTDFGIAHVIEPDGPGEGLGGMAAGTPRYMAPEQLRGAWRDFGPWTDLYALGCMAFELASGAVPHDGATPLAIASRRLTGPAPRVVPLRPMPAGFVDWLARMMAPEPRDRFACAADAAHALADLPAPPTAVERQVIAHAMSALGEAASGEATTFDGLGPRAAMASTLSVVVHDRWRAASAGTRMAASPAQRPPIPETWYAETPDRPLLRGVGLGLFGVRAVPFAGRERVRNTLWDSLRRVALTGRAEVALIEGPEGIGKTALAEWLLRRAREVGAADGMRFRFSALDGPGDALSAGLRAWLRGHGLEQEALIARIVALLGDDPEGQAQLETVFAPSLARLVDQGDDARDGVVLSPTERFSTERAFFERAARGRPLIVLYDDLHWGADSLAFVDWLLDRELEAPVLIVATARETDDLDPDDRAALARVRRRAQTITLGPLSPAAHDAVVEALLGLDPALAGALRGHTAGSPLFTVQTLAEWVEGEALAPTPTGYAAPAGHALPLPADLGALATSRLGRVLDASTDPTAARRAVRLAACLGDAVDGGEWSAACAALGLTAPEGLLDGLCDAGLASSGREGWVFGHGFVRRALVEAARGDTAWAAMQRACADAVSTGRSPIERRARHLLDAGEVEAAIDALGEAARVRMDGSEYRRALALCARRDALMDRVALPADDVRRARTLPVEVSALRFIGRMDAAREVAARLDGFPIGPEHGDLLAERARISGARAILMGDAGGHRDGYARAAALYARIGDGRGQARALHGLGWSHIIHGRFADGVALMEQSRRVAEAAGCRVDVGWAWHGEVAARVYGELPGVEAPLDAAERVFGEVRLPSGIALVRADRADVALLAGDDAESRRHAEAAWEIFTAHGSHLVFRAEMTLALLELRAGAHEAGHRRICRVIDGGAVRSAAMQHRFGWHVLGAWSGLQVGDEAMFAAQLAAVEAGPPGTFFLHPALRRTLLEMGAELEKRRRPQDAARVWAQAARYWQVVDGETAKRCATRARALGGAG